MNASFIYSLFNRAGWHRVQMYKLLAQSGFHVVTFDYRGKSFFTPASFVVEVVYKSREEV